ncbi:hypothetical protein [Psychroserpens sp. MEBiC05023]
MKQLQLIILMLSLVTINAQNRYYPSLSSLVELEEQSSIPKDLIYLKNWYDQCVKHIYYQDMQFNSNPRNSATFKSLGLIFRKDKEFEFYKSGLQISFEVDPQKKVDPVRLINNHYWNGLAYGIIINLDDYNPEGDFYRFLILRRMQSMSEAQTLANFINVFTEPNKDQSALEKFIEDVNNANEINVVYNKDMTLSELSKAINNEMPTGTNVYWAPYNTYINTKIEKDTRINLERFFRPLSVYDVESTINDNITPYGDLEFETKKVKLTLPKKYFKHVSSSSKKLVSFFIHKIDYDLNYDYKNKNYEFSMKLYPTKDSTTIESYRFKCKYKDFFDNHKEKVKRTEVGLENIEYVEINFRPKSYSISISTNDMRNLEFYKDFKVN